MCLIERGLIYGKMKQLVVNQWRKSVAKHASARQVGQAVTESALGGARP